MSIGSMARMTAYWHRCATLPNDPQYIARHARPQVNKLPTLPNQLL